MAKRKPHHQQQRNLVFNQMMQLFSGKSVAHPSKKAYRRQAKHRHAQTHPQHEQGWQSQPFLVT
jgi:hypothetical protein